ncbi:MAG: FAD-dependent oxidoreductase [Piscinibacter sp.]|nr:FAD-dependent oxidoreductase [Piscinibacter sp.]
MRRVVIVGAGQAGVQSAEALRSLGFDGEITLLGDEAHAPYHRPPLSKGWLAGDMQAAQLVLRAPEALARKGIVLRTGVPVQAIDRTTRELHLAGGERLAWDGLVLATGARPRRLPMPHAEAPNVHVLRSRDDASALAAALDACAAAGAPLVVLGGGFIGLEVAATARKKGLTVGVLEAQPRLLARALPPLLSDWFAQLHRSHGVGLELAAQVEALQAGADGRVTAIRLADGRNLPCGALLLGVGAVANDELARAAGLACEGGIVVDACGRTADPAIVAAGDCSVRRLPDGSLLRLESVQGATEGGKAAAAALLGLEKPFTAAPWFWSDQFGRKLQMAGLGAAADRSVLRGRLDGAGFSVWHYCRERLVGVDTIDLAKDHLLARRLLDAGLSPDPMLIADPAYDPAGLLASPPATPLVAGSR